GVLRQQRDHLRLLQDVLLVFAAQTIAVANESEGRLRCDYTRREGPDAVQRCTDNAVNEAIDQRLCKQCREETGKAACTDDRSEQHFRCLLAGQLLQTTCQYVQGLPERGFDT